jgi:phosphoketolase
MKRKTSSEIRLGAGELHSIERYRRAVNYLAAAQIYLKDNPRRRSI